MLEFRSFLDHRPALPRGATVSLEAVHAQVAAVRRPLGPLFSTGPSEAGPSEAGPSLLCEEDELTMV